MSTIKKSLILFLCIISILCVNSTPVKAQDKPSFEERMTFAVEKLPKPWYPKDKPKPETKEQRKKRIKLIIEIINEQSKKSDELGWYWSQEDLAWAIFVKTWFESGRFRHSVHTGKWRGDGGRSVCLGQIMNGGETLVGTSREKTTNCIKRVAEILVMHQRRCLSSNAKPSAWAMAMIYAGYGTGHSCKADHVTYLRNRDGSFIIKDGKRIASKWALKRGWMWWQLRSEKY